MKTVALISLVLALAGCGKASPSVATQTPPNNNVTQPTPTPTPNPFVGVWQGQDYTSSFQDVVTFNNDGTGSQVSCGWTFYWQVDPDTTNHPSTIDIRFLTFPTTPNAGCRNVTNVCGTDAFGACWQLNITYSWGIYLTIEQLLGPGIGIAYQQQ